MTKAQLRAFFQRIDNPQTKFDELAKDVYENEKKRHTSSRAAEIAVKTAGSIAVSKGIYGGEKKYRSGGIRVKQANHINQKFTILLLTSKPDLISYFAVLGIPIEILLKLAGGKGIWLILVLPMGISMGFIICAAIIDRKQSKTRSIKK